MTSTIITIGRQYSSGGHKIGEYLSNRLEIPYYDDEIMIIMAGLDEALSKSTRDSCEAVHDPLYYSDGEGVSFSVYKKVMRELAQKGDAIVIGRCADEILRNEGCNVLSVFIAAPLEHRIARTMRIEGMPEEEVIRAIEQKDAARRQLYELHADRRWGVPESYDLYYDTSETDIGSIIVDIVKHYKALRDKVSAK